MVVAVVEVVAMSPVIIVMRQATCLVNALSLDVKEAVEVDQEVAAEEIAVVL